MSTAKTVKYASLIFKDDKKVNEERKAEAIDDASMELENQIHAAKKANKTAGKQVARAMGSVPFCGISVINAEIAAEEATDTLERLESLKRLF